jgi:hypothetical protein
MKSEKPEVEIDIRKAGHMEYIAVIFVEDIETWRTPNYSKTPHGALDEAIEKADEMYYDF